MSYSRPSLMIIASWTQFHVYLPWWGNSNSLNSVLNVKALVGAFNQEKALVGPVVEPMEQYGALHSTTVKTTNRCVPWWCIILLTHIDIPIYFHTFCQKTTSITHNLRLFVRLLCKRRCGLPPEQNVLGLCLC